MLGGVVRRQRQVCIRDSTGSGYGTHLAGARTRTRRGGRANAARRRRRGGRGTVAWRAAAPPRYTSSPHTSTIVPPFLLHISSPTRPYSPLHAPFPLIKNIFPLILSSYNTKLLIISSPFFFLTHHTYDVIHLIPPTYVSTHTLSSTNSIT